MDQDDSDQGTEKEMKGRGAKRVTKKLKQAVVSKRGRGKVQLRSSKMLKSDGQKQDETTVVAEDLEKAEGSNDVVQDQIIVAPEIMTLILRRLDFPSLKQVRLVCKSWLREAHAHMETRGIVHLEVNGSARINKFLEMRQKKIEGLPQLFETVAVDLLRLEEKFVSQVAGLSPPLAITRLSSEKLPWELALQLISQCSHTLEYLKLVAGEYDTICEPPKDPEQTFPKLRHVAVGISKQSRSPISWTRFSSIVAWVVNRSPTLENYESLINQFTDTKGLESELLLQLNLKTVKSLKLAMKNLNKEALEHFKSTPFHGIENLDIEISVGEQDFCPSTKEAIVGAVKKSAMTIKKLKLYDCHAMETLAACGFPVCPNLEELTSGRFPCEDNHRYSESSTFISHHFPALQVWNVSNFVMCERLWSSVPPFLGLKTFRTQIVRTFMPVFTDLRRGALFFEKFPNLEHLYIEPSYLKSFARARFERDPRFSKLLNGVKHLEIQGDDGDYGNHHEKYGYEFLSDFKGVETITFMKPCAEISSVPVKKMPRLKMIQFPWGDDVDCCGDLQDMTEGVEKVVISNCCSILKGHGRDHRDERFKSELKEFFETAPNAVCGCKDWKQSPFKW